MLNKNFNVEITINGERVDIYDLKSLNLRINNVLYSPTEIVSKSGEYSFSFELPATDKNNRIFHNSNDSAKRNKFNSRFDCQVSANGTEIFSGVLRLSDTTQSSYKCNLVNVKVYNVSDIFGEMMMNELVWKVDFDGADTINSVNADLNSKYFFPLVSYGAFQKRPYATYNSEISIYTDLLDIDRYNLWYWETMHPSLNLLELVKRLFAQKGYTVSGDIFNDKVMKNIYVSEYIDSSQDPIYNIGSDDIGTLHIAGKFDNSYGLNAYTRISESMGQHIDEVYPPHVISSYQDLTYPKEYVAPDVYNYDRICWFDVLGTNTKEGVHEFTVPPTNSYLYRQNSPKNTSGFIYIPADGLYTIELTVDDISIEDEQDDNIYVDIKERISGGDVEEKQIPLTKDFSMMPVEIHLLRNSNETELIWREEYQNMYPHEMDYSKYKTTEAAESSTHGGRRAPERETTAIIPDEKYYTPMGSIIAYDPFANENFICGLSTENLSPAVIKNGRSWNPSCSAFNQSHFRCGGYIKRTGNTESPSDYNRTTLQCPYQDYFVQNSLTNAKGKVTCVVELKKNDRITLELVTRYYYGLLRVYKPPFGFDKDDGTYKVKFNYDIKITPYTSDKDRYINVQDLYYLPSEEIKESGWGTKLNLGNFLNVKEKASDFIDNFIKSFNLQYIQNGNNIILNRSKVDFTPRDFVDLDGRVNTKDATFSRIEYPSWIQVAYNIDYDEAGAYRSIDTVEHQGASNWKDYVDTGSDKIMMDTLNENNAETLDSKFAYTWYENFNYIGFDKETLQPNGDNAVFRLPLIAKDEDFIIQNDDAMKKDGLSLKQRLWFRQPPTDKKLILWNTDEVYATIPTDTYEGYILNYRRGEGTMLSKCFNVSADVGKNMVEFETYLTPTEYVRLKAGCSVKFDDDFYHVCEIQGYDPTGNSPTTLRLINI